MATAEIIRKSEFARRAGVSHAAISRSVALKPACVGSRIDASHPAALKYLSKRVLPPPPPPPRSPGWTGVNEKKKDEPAPVVEIPEDIRKFGNMKLSKLVDLFGTDQRFVDWLKATKSIEDIHEKRLKNAQTERSLVSRELIQIGVLDVIEQTHIKLLTDGAKTMTAEIIAMHDAGDTVQECTKYASDQMGSFIKPMKAKVGRGMKKVTKRAGR